jgi:glutaredoxin
MNFESPAKKGYTIYTKSGCHFCTKAKQLLVKEQIYLVDCDEYLIEARSQFLEFIKSISGGIDHKTFPIIFYQGNYIGGFADLKVFYDRENAFGECMF